MPKRTDIESILIIGAGPIIIGQACEFDYSGTQACRVLKEEGYRVILINSNPATIMTDPTTADRVYIEPITPEFVEKIIAKEKPDALLPTMGGQTALNCAKSLAESGILQKYNVELIGASLDAINKAEDRGLFNQAMAKINLEVPKNAVIHNLDEANAHIKEIGLPAIIRPSFTLGGTGGGIAYNKEEFEHLVQTGLDASPVTEVLIDESVLGWKEYEMEVVRDKNDNCIIVCAIENVDPMGVHTGDSITVAPALTLTDKEYQIMRDASLAVLREIGVETGGSNVQFAVNPDNGRMVVIEMNPRVSRSSALASKATGFPIAKVATKLAIGYSLDEIANDITGTTPASFEPTIDYIVTKIPRFAFEKFPGSEPNLTTAMKSVGEAMAIGRNFAESFQKAIRSLETGFDGLEPIIDSRDANNIDIIKEKLTQATPKRLLIIADAFRAGMSVADIHEICHYDPWFLHQIEAIVLAEQDIIKNGLPTNKIALLSLKKMGFADRRLAKLSGKTESDVRKMRESQGIKPIYKRVDSCAAEFESLTSYSYSSYEGDGISATECESDPTARQKVVILGGGPNRIGQGIEFDYCCVHACYALKEQNIEAIMINCNPETVSTDYDTADRLYFEPLEDESVINIIQKEQERGELLGVIVQFGGQTPLKLVAALEEYNIPVIGTPPDAIDLAEDRERFKELLARLSLKQPQNSICRDYNDAIGMAEEIGYPVVVRPSYVLGGRAMMIIYDSASLREYLSEIIDMFGDGPILIDGYLEGAIEVDVDALCDGKEVFVAGIMEHIEEAGIHSGDSACSLPPYSLSKEIVTEIEQQTSKLAVALGVVGLMNIQFAVKGNDIYILEVNPRASRTVPFVAKATAIPLAAIAAQLMIGKKLGDFELKKYQQNQEDLIAVKEAVFPFARFPGVDVLLGPEMKSTGEVMGIDTDFASAFARAQIGAGNKIPTSGVAFISVKDSDKAEAVEIAKKLIYLGFELIATGGTAEFLQNHDIAVKKVNKVRQGRPHIVDMLKDNLVTMVINTTKGSRSISDSHSIRSTALEQRVSYCTTISGAKAMLGAIEVMQNKGSQLEVRAIN